MFEHEVQLGQTGEAGFNIFIDQVAKQLLPEGAPDDGGMLDDAF